MAWSTTLEERGLGDSQTLLKLRIFGGLYFVSSFSYSTNTYTVCQSSIARFFQYVSWRWCTWLWPSSHQRSLRSRNFSRGMSFLPCSVRCFNQSHYYLLNIYPNQLLLPGFVLCNTQCSHSAYRFELLVWCFIRCFTYQSVLLSRKELMNLSHSALF